MTEKLQRETKQRKIILDAVLGRYDHPTAYDIYVEIHKKYPTISKATVYRNLNVLAKTGKIKHVKIVGADRFDSTVCNHYHVICSKCGKVVDAGVTYIEQNDKLVEKATGFKIEGHGTLFEGICPDCQKIKE